jgi:hypothetical protein
MPETPSEYMDARQAARLAADLSQCGGRNSLVDRIGRMERQCRQASRLIRAMLQQVHSSDVFRLPEE